MAKKFQTKSLKTLFASKRNVATVRKSTWTSIVDGREAQRKPLVVDMSNLPTAPGSTVDIDYSTLPNKPPFVAHIADLSFETDDKKLRQIFSDLNPISTRTIQDGPRSGGVGLVEFETRESLTEALKGTNKDEHGQKIRINVSDGTDFHQTNGNQNNLANQLDRIEEEQLTMTGTGKRKRIKSESDELPDGLSNGNDHGRSNYNNGPRKDQRGSDYERVCPRIRNDHVGVSNHNRQQPQYRIDDTRRVTTKTRFKRTSTRKDLLKQPHCESTRIDSSKPMIIEEMQSKIDRMESKIQQMVKNLLQSEECLPMLEKMIVDEVLNIDTLVTTMFEVVDTLNEQTLTHLSTYIAQYITTHKSFSLLEEQLVNMNLRRKQLMKRISYNIHEIIKRNGYQTFDASFIFNHADLLVINGSEHM